MSRNKPYILFDDLVSKYLNDFQYDSGVVPRVVESVAVALKEDARRAHKRKFRQRTGSFNKSIWFKQRRKSSRANLFAGNLASIYEKKGAFIQPMKGKAMKFVINGETIFYKGVIRIPPMPYFYAAMFNSISRGVDKEAALKQIAIELKEKHLVRKTEIF